MLQFSGVAAERAATVGFHVRVDAAVAEDEAGCGQNCWIRAKLLAKRAVPVVHSGLSSSTVIGWDGQWVLAALLLLQVEGGRRCRQGGESFHGTLIV